MTNKLLVPVDLPDPEPLSPVLIEHLSSLDIVVMGFYQVKEQTPRRSAREQFGDEAQEMLDEIAAQFEAAGASVSTRLTFGKNRADSINRIMIEEKCAAELNPAPIENVDSILVPMPEVPEMTHLPDFLDYFCASNPSNVTFFYVAEQEGDRERGEEILTEARDGMVDACLNLSTVNTKLVEGESHDQEILNAADEYDLVVMYEGNPSLSDRVFGSLPDRVVSQTNTPVIVVRRDF